jgi:hypothetical protein
MTFARRNGIQNQRRHFGAIMLVTALAAPISRVALAESTGRDATAALAAAEQAYQQVDFESVYGEASRGLTWGHANSQQTGRLYVLLGISAAALGKNEESKQYFVSALAITPSLRLDNNLAPKFRGSYLEARGYWGAYQDRLSLRATTDGSGERLALVLEDPAHLARQLRVYLRPSGSSTYMQRVLEASPATRTQIPADMKRLGFEYYAQLVDEHGNALFELGHAEDPIVVPSTVRAPNMPTPKDTAGGTSSATAAASRSLWLPGLLAIGGLAATGAGVYFNVRRENEAQQWNGPSCEQPGLSRLNQCTDVDADRRKSERLAIGFYAGGGALLVGSLTSWLWGGKSEPKRDSRHVAGPPLSCQASFSGLGLFCHGQF